MADFFQNAITTFHRLGEPDLDDMEAELVRFSKQRPIALVIPCLYSELKRPALRQIMDTLARVPYLDEVIVALGRANERQYRHAQTYFSELESGSRRVRLLWNEGPRMQRVYRALERRGVHCGSRGKGRAAWAAYGYVLASSHAKVIVAHDSDIVTYDRELLARLVYPIANPDAGLAFAKGYYARTSDRLHGRVMRLFVTPLIRALRDTVGDQPFLKYLDSYRYALAGEFAMDVDLARQIRMPSDWGLEIGVLAEVYRNTELERVCQTDIADAFDHKHQDLSGSDPRHGLQRMAVDVAQSLFRTLGGEGVSLHPRVFESVIRRYKETGAEYVDRYELEAGLNQLYFDRHAEEKAVAAFTEALRVATKRYLRDPLGAPWIPSWDRVLALVPDALDRFYTAVEEDNARAVPRLVQTR